MIANRGGHVALVTGRTRMHACAHTCEGKKHCFRQGLCRHGACNAVCTRMKRRLLPLTVAIASGLGCSAEQPRPKPAPTPTIAPNRVPAAPDVVDSVVQCTSLASGERLRSVSPEGHAWLARESETGQHLRVLDPLDGSETAADVALVGLVELVASSGTNAAARTDDGLYQLEDLQRILVSPPAKLAAAAICGNPTHNGFVLDAGTLYERDADAWLEWDWNVGDDAEPPTRIVAIDGECIGTDNATWLVSDGGDLWQLDEGLALRHGPFAPGAIAAKTDGMLAVLEAERLITGPFATPERGWQPWIFEGVMPTTMSASGGALWLTAGAQLLRRWARRPSRLRGVFREP